MSDQVDFQLPEQQNGNLQIVLSPPTSISGWTIQTDLMYRFNSPQPILSLYLASGYTSGQSGCTIVDGVQGIFNVSYSGSQVSGLSQSTNVLCYKSFRTDSGAPTPLVGGYRLLTLF